MLKHGRFLQNLIVSPVYPKPIFQEDDNDDAEEGEAEIVENANEE